MSHTPNTFRLPEDIVAHLTYAKQKSDLSKTKLVERALREYLQQNFPLPLEHEGAAA